MRGDTSAIFPSIEARSPATSNHACHIDRLPTTWSSTSLRHCYRLPRHLRQQCLHANLGPKVGSQNTDVMDSSERAMPGCEGQGASSARWMLDLEVRHALLHVFSIRILHLNPATAHHRQIDSAVVRHCSLRKQSQDLSDLFERLILGLSLRPAWARVWRCVVRCWMRCW